MKKVNQVENKVKDEEKYCITLSKQHIPDNVNSFGLRRLIMFEWIKKIQHLSKTITEIG